METHSGILAWRIPWTEEPGGLQSSGLQRVGHDWATDTHTLTETLRCGLPAGMQLTGNKHLGRGGIKNHWLCCIWNEWPMRTYCLAQGALMWQFGWEGYLEEEGYVYTYDWVPLLFTRNYHNIIDQLYFSAKLKVENKWIKSTLIKKKKNHSFFFFFLPIKE